MKADRRGELRQGDGEVIVLHPQYLNHPALTLGYRLRSGGNTVVYALDHEPHAPNPAARAEGEPPRHQEDQRHIAFLADADLVIHDAQYTIAEYAQKTGWGHTPAEWVVDYAVAAGAGDWRSPTMIRSGMTKRLIASSKCVAGAPALLGADSMFSPRPKAKNCVIVAARRLEGSRREIHFAVYDTGIGIPKDRFDRLFKVFRGIITLT
jgi:hypothetical protein